MKYKLADLIAGMSENRRGEIDFGPPRGREFPNGYGSPDDDLDAFIAGVDAALEREFGPDHQAVLSGGPVVASFWWETYQWPLRRVTDGR